MDRLKRILPYLGFGAFYLVAFFFSCYLTFPYDALRDRVVAEFAAEQKGKPQAQQRLEIDSLEPYWFTGVRARGVRITTASAPKPFEHEVEPPTEIDVEELHARIGVFARIFGKTSVTFYAKAFGGEAEGSYVDGASERKIEVELTDVAVGHIDPLVHLVGLPLYGSMKGKVDLTFPDKRVSKADGTIQLTISDLAVGDGKAKIKNALALPKINAGDLTLDVEVREGVAKINKLAAAGTDLELAADGRINLRDQPSESGTDVYVRFKFTDAYKNRNDITRGLFGAPGSTAPALFELADPKIKSSKRPDGFYGWHMTGILGNARFDPYTGAAGGTPGGMRPTSPGLKFPR